MLLFYRTMVLVSSLNPKLLQTHPITRTATAEAVLRFLVLGDHPDTFWIAKKQIFAYILQTDPKASIISFTKLWPEIVQSLGCSRYATTQYYNGEQILSVKNSDMRNLIEDIIYKINNKEFEDMDRRDAALKHLFEEEVTKPDIGSIMKFDVNGRLRTTADDKLDKIATSIESISALAQRVSEEQSLLEIVVKQNKLATESIENQIDRIDKKIDKALETAIRISEIAEKIGATQQTVQAEPERKMTMAERITKAAAETGTGVLSAIQEGGKISLSQKTNQQIVNLFHKHLGHHIPGATSPVGKKVEAIAIPGLLHFAAAAFSDKIPHVDVVQRACLRAITGESKDGMDEVVDVLLPLFRDIISSEGLVGEVIKEMASVEQIEQAPSPLQIEGHDTRALAESLMEQLKGIPAGEPVEIKLVVSRKDPAKQLVPPTEK